MPNIFKQIHPIPLAKLHHIYNNHHFGPTVAFDGKQY
jgi:hypothetical protein